MGVFDARDQQMLTAAFETALGNYGFQRGGQPNINPPGTPPPPGTPQNNAAGAGAGAGDGTTAGNIDANVVKDKKSTTDACQCVKYTSRVAI